MKNQMEKEMQTGFVVQVSLGLCEEEAQTAITIFIPGSCISMV